MLLKLLPIRYRKPAAKFRRSKKSAAPAALTLVSAAYTPSQWVEMTFDRAVDISAILVEQILVDDGPISSVIWRGTGTATLVDPSTVRVPVTEFDAGVSAETVLTASATNGIVAVDNEQAWAGVTDLPLPFNA